jgi:serine protease Do
VVGKDKGSSLILLKIDENTLTPIKQARHYEVGDWIALVGAFYQEFPSIYQGILSSESGEQLILNAPVVPGSAGGAAVNKKGELIGVIRGRVGFAVSPDYTFSDPSGEIRIEIPKSLHKDLCAAVPLVKVLDIYRDLKKFGKVRRGWLGVVMDFKDGKVHIAKVVKNSPAEKAGIRKGDVIKKINGETIKATGEVVKIVGEFKPEQKVKIELSRANTPQSALVVIGEYEESQFDLDPAHEYSYSMGEPIDDRFLWVGESLPAAENFLYRLEGNRILGVDATMLTPELAKEFNVGEKSGLMISRVYKDTAAQKAGFRPADIIVKVGDQPIKTHSDLRRVLDELADNEAVVVELYRKGEMKKVKVVPDKRQGFGLIFDRFRDKMKEINVRIDEEKREELEELAREEQQNLKQIQEKYLKQLEKIKQEEWEKYKTQMEKMIKEQEKMRKEVEKLKQELEKEEKEPGKEKQKESTATTI